MCPVCGNMSTGCTLRSWYADAGTSESRLRGATSFQHSCARSLACRAAAGSLTVYRRVSSHSASPVNAMHRSAVAVALAS